MAILKSKEVLRAEQLGSDRYKQQLLDEQLQYDKSKDSTFLKAFATYKEEATRFQQLLAKGQAAEAYRLWFAFRKKKRPNRTLTIDFKNWCMGYEVSRRRESGMKSAVALKQVAELFYASEAKVAMAYTTFKRRRTGERNRRGRPSRKI